MTMSSRYSQHARRAMTHARLVARGRRHGVVDTSHLLVGILLAEGSIGQRVLADLEVNAAAALAQLDVLHLAQATPPTTIPLTEDLRDTLALSIAESDSLGHHYVGTEHLLLGLARGYKPPTAHLLRTLDISADQLRRQVRRVLQSGETEINLEKAKRQARLSELSLRTLNRAALLARANGQNEPDLPHLLKALAQENRSRMSRLLAECGLNEARLDEATQRRRYYATNAIESVLDSAVIIAERLSSHYTGTDHMVLALAHDRRGAALLRHVGVNLDVLVRRMGRGE